MLTMKNSVPRTARFLFAILVNWRIASGILTRIEDCLFLSIIEKLLTVHKIPVFIRQFAMITMTSLKVSPAYEIYVENEGYFFGDRFWLS